MEEVKVETKKITKTKATPKKKETKAKKSITIKNELKKRAKEIEIEVMNITNGSVFYSDGSTSVDIDYPGDTDIVSLKFLESRKVQRGLLEKLYISICDVFDDEFTLEDILSYLNLSKYYVNNKMTIEAMDEFLEESDVEEFENILSNCDLVVLRRFAERAATLSREGKFGSIYKRTCLEKLTHDEFLFGTR